MPPTRKSYTAEFKLQLIKFAAENGNRAAERTFGVSEKLIRDWRKAEVKLTGMKKTKKANRGLKTRWPELEERVHRWVVEQRAAGRRLSTAQLHLHAQVIAREMNIDDFAGGRSWCYRFMQRKRLSIRPRATSCRKLPPDFQAKVDSFHAFVKGEIAAHGVSPERIVSVDEVPLTFDVSISQSVAEYEQTGEGGVAPGHEKSYFTVVLACCGDGSKLLPMVICKRKTMPRAECSSTVVVAINEKGWMDEETMNVWLTKCYSQRHDAFFKTHKALLVMDSKQAHVTVQIKDKIKACNSVPAIIPGGLKKILHPLDLAVNRSFKAVLRHLSEKWMATTEHGLTATHHATFQDVIGWIDRAWTSVTTDAILSGFRKAGLIGTDADVSVTIATMSIAVPTRGEVGGGVAAHLQCQFCGNFSKSHAQELAHIAATHPTRLDCVSMGRLGNILLYQSTARLFHCSDCFYTCRDFSKLYQHIISKHCLDEKGVAGGGDSEEGDRREHKTGEEEEEEEEEQSSPLKGSEAEGKGKKEGGEKTEGETGEEGEGVPVKRKRSSEEEVKGEVAGEQEEGKGEAGEEGEGMPPKRKRSSEEDSKGEGGDKGDSKGEGGDQDSKGEGGDQEDSKAGDEDTKGEGGDQGDSKGEGGDQGDSKGEGGVKEDTKGEVGEQEEGKGEGGEQNKEEVEGHEGATKTANSKTNREIRKAVLLFDGYCYCCTICGWKHQLKSVAVSHVVRRHDIPKAYGAQAVTRDAASAAAALKQVQSGGAEEEEVLTGEMLKQEMAATSKVINYTSNRFVCLICGWKTKLKGFAINHVMRSHDVERPYSCKECQRAFFLPSRLQQHIRTEHRPGRYACPFCCFRSHFLGGFRRHCSRCNARGEEGGGAAVAAVAAAVEEDEEAEDEEEEGEEGGLKRKMALRGGRKRSVGFEEAEDGEEDEEQEEE